MEHIVGLIPPVTTLDKRTGSTIQSMQLMEHIVGLIPPVTTLDKRTGSTT